MTYTLNQQSCKLLFRKVGFPIHSRKSFGISVTSLPVSICISKSKTCISVSFSSTLSTFFFLFLFFVFFLICILLENVSFLSNLYKFSPNPGLFLFYFMFPSTIRTFFFLILICKYRRKFVRWVDFYNALISVFIFVAV